MFDWEAHRKRTEWFVRDRFGMFIHWGLYAIPARGEWVRSQERIAAEDYEPYFREFDPVDYDPRAWARAAKDAGMRYAVLTAKHHDGFCLFDSTLTGYKATNTKCGRDLVREFLEAFRAEGLKAGLYYSLLDWHHPDYPHCGDLHHPMRDNTACGNEGRDFGRYLDYLHGQVEELCTRYGKIDLFWFDFSYGEMSGEKWRATDLVRMIRRYQPDAILDNRLEENARGCSSMMQGDPKEYAGDFVSPEQIIPEHGVRDEKGRPVLWEACVTMNNHWGYCAQDDHFKPAPMLIKKLVECVSKGGNLLLNVGPDARGNIPPRSLGILEEIGAWMRRNGASIYGCGPGGVAKPDCGRVTAKGDTLYYHIMEPFVGYVPLSGVPLERVESVRLLRDGSELIPASDWVVRDYPGVLFVSFGDNPLPPDPVDTVVEVRLKP